MHPLLVIVASLALLVPAPRSAQAQPVPTAATAPSAPDTLAQRMQACVVCHGREGRATDAGYFPRIAGKPAGYLHEQLRHFQAGRRQNVAMRHMVRHLSDAYLQEIAKHFAAIDLPYPPARDAGLTADESRIAERLVRDGAPERGIPACTACHGAAMAGRLPAMPGLLTLPDDYIRGQLGAWRTGQRRARAPDCMAEVARRLRPEEIAAVSRWLSSRTLPAGTPPEPAPATAAALPLPCGAPP